jgi:hypothetical protein
MKIGGNKVSNENKTSKPKSCLNCNSESILGPYGGRNTLIEIGVTSFLRQEVYICAVCGFTMQFTFKKQTQQLARK